MAIEARRDIFQAIADPTRRQIIHLISKKSLNVNAISDQFDISKSAVSQQIKILVECGIIVIRQEGRERFCEPRLAKLRDVSDWISQYHQFWDEKFTSLDKYLKKKHGVKPLKKNNK